MKTQEFTTTMDQAVELMRAAYHAVAKALETATGAGRHQVLAIDEENIDPSTLQLDAALLAAAPVVVAPPYSEFFPLQENGHRFVLAADGIYLEARRPWLHFIHRIGAVTGVKIPYGTVEPKVELAFGKVSAALPQLQEFAAHAVAEAPLEAAGTILWNKATDTWRIAFPKTIGSATNASIQFEQVEPGPDEHVVIDMHSHGHLPAFFSTTDDIDDAGSIKIAGVVGNLDTTEPTAVLRICVLGVTIPMSLPVDRVFA